MDHWMSTVARAVDNEDGEALREIFGVLTADGSWRPVPAFISGGHSSQLSSQLVRKAGQVLDGKWADAAVEYGGCLEAASKGEFAGAYRGLSAAYLIVIR